MTARELLIVLLVTLWSLPVGSVGIGANGPSENDILQQAETRGAKAAAVLPEKKYDETRAASGSLAVTGAVATGPHDGRSPKKRDLTGFWVIGVLINIVVMSSFAVWAVRQWRKTGK